MPDKTKHNAQASEKAYESNELIAATKGKKFLIVGENHLDKSISKILCELIDSHNFNAIYLEALRRGCYQVEGDALKEGKFSVYAHDPEKYDHIIDYSVRNGLRVYGFDLSGRPFDKLERRYKNGFGISIDEDIVDYIRSKYWADSFKMYPNNDGTALILTGAAHVNYSDAFFQNNIDDQTIDMARKMLLRVKDDKDMDFMEELSIECDAINLTSGCSNIAMHMRKAGIINQRNDFVTLSQAMDQISILENFSVNTVKCVPAADFIYLSEQPHKNTTVILCDPTKYLSEYLGPITRK